jgi:hypothetical protein
MGVCSLNHDTVANLCSVVIPLAKELTVPDDAPVKLPTAPDVCTLGTLSAIGEEMETKCLETISEFKREGRDIRSPLKDWVKLYLSNNTVYE